MRDIPYEQTSLFAGISGGATGDTKAQLGEFFARFKFAKADNGSDAENIIAGGLSEEDGIALIMGTGSVAFVQKDGEVFRIGGFGYLFDHGGCGYDIANMAIRSACMSEDGRGEETLLRTYFLETLKKESMLDCLSHFYDIGKYGIASYCPLVFKAYRAGDSVAERILKKNMKHVAKLLVAGDKLLQGEAPVKVSLVGGLTKEIGVLMPMIESDLPYPERFDISVYDKDVVYGALLRAGLPKDTEVLGL
jgi:N-acetylglucosamine kinase-like BadF-type ATPase